MNLGKSINIEVSQQVNVNVVNVLYVQLINKVKKTCYWSLNEILWSKISTFMFTLRNFNKFKTR